MTKLRFGVQTILAVALACTPILASAAYEQPSDVIAALKSQSANIEFSAEVHGNAAPYYASVWINGSAGERENATLVNAKTTVDVVLPGGKVRAKLQMKQTESDSYVLVDEVSGNFNDAVAHLVASFQMKKWMQMPGMDLSMLGNVDPSTIDSQFTLTSKTAANGSVTYTLTPTEETLTELRTALQQMANEAGRTDADFTATTFEVNIVMNAKGEFVSGNFSLLAKSGDILFSAKGTSWKQNGTFTVTKPSPVYSWTEGIFGFGADTQTPTSWPDWPSWIGVPDAGTMNNLIMPMGDGNSDGMMQNTSGWGGTMDTGTGSSNWVPECNTSELRRGECPQWVSASPRRQ